MAGSEHSSANVKKSLVRAAGVEVTDIHRTIRGRILVEQYYPGQKLSENALAREFGCSRTPVREALKRLERERLIEVRPQSGAYVRAVTTEDYADLLEVRAYIEGLAFRLAVERWQSADIEALEADLQAMDKAVKATPIDMQRYAELHYGFHFRLIRISGNNLLAGMFEALNLRSSHMFLRSMNAESAARTQEEHHRIVRQLRERDSKGEKFVVDHLWRNRSLVVVHAGREGGSMASPSRRRSSPGSDGSFSRSRSPR